MNLLLQAQWVTQASDFLTQNWDKLLGILGGASGIIALLTLIGKIILVCIQGKIARKNNTPLQTAFSEFSHTVNLTLEQLKSATDNYINSMKEELKEYLKELLEKAQKMKIALYDKLITEGENAQDLLDELNVKIEEAQTLIEEKKNSSTESSILSETNADEQETETIQIEEQEQNMTVSEPIKRKRKVKRVVVER